MQVESAATDDSLLTFFPQRGKTKVNVVKYGLEKLQDMLIEIIGKGLMVRSLQVTLNG